MAHKNPFPTCFSSMKNPTGIQNQRFITIITLHLPVKIAYRIIDSCIEIYTKSQLRPKQFVRNKIISLKNHFLLFPSNTYLYHLNNVPEAKHNMKNIRTISNRLQNNHMV